MRHLLNTLYVTTQGAYVSREGETVLVRVEHETKLRVPIHTLGGIVCFGQVSCSPPLMELCGERNVAISFLSEHGKFYARVQGPVSGNVLLRREQYRRADSESTSAEIARMVVVAKVANCRTVLLRAIRDHADPARQDQASALEAAALRLARQLDDLRQPAPLWMPCAEWKETQPGRTSTSSTISSPRRRKTFSSASAAAARHSTTSMPCSRSFTRSSPTT